MITAATALYCVLGNPVSHSKSPVVHNAAFKDKGIDAAYLAFAPDNIRDAVTAVRTFNIRGASVTIPFKEVIREHLDWIDPGAEEIGAVNTVVNKHGRLMGYNTDCDAAVAPLRKFGINGKKICIVGAGGAARAVAHGIAREGGQIIIVNRTPAKGVELADRVEGIFVPVEKAGEIKADVIINTTSLGMEPDTETLSFPEQAIEKGMVVMDVVYTPVETRLLKTARSRNCATVDGLSMFIAQAAAQFKLWTGMEPDTELMRQTVLKS